MTRRSQRVPAPETLAPQGFLGLWGTKRNGLRLTTDQKVGDSSSSGRANASLDSQWVSATGKSGEETGGIVFLRVFYRLAPNS